MNEETSEQNKGDKVVAGETSSGKMRTISQLELRIFGADLCVFELPVKRTSGGSIYKAKRVGC